MTDTKTVTAPVSLAEIKARKASLVSGLIGMTEAERDALVELACEAMTRRPIADTPAPQPPAWDCYSPVALVLWRAADFAEAGFAGAPCLKAACELNRTDLWIDAVHVTQAIDKDNLKTCIASREWAIALRIAAEFGPAGRPN